MGASVLPGDKANAPQLPRGTHDTLVCWCVFLFSATLVIWINNLDCTLPELFAEEGTFDFPAKVTFFNSHTKMC